jgi:cobalt-zinc-cadmium efflux system membrane fusion protein
MNAIITVLILLAIGIFVQRRVSASKRKARAAAQIAATVERLSIERAIERTRTIKMLLILAAFFVLGNGCAPSAVPPIVHAKPPCCEWWCYEHGVPECICTICNPRLVQEFKARGDWCSKHDLPDSHCTVCHPEFAADFAALYEAHYGRPLVPRED